MKSAPHLTSGTLWRISGRGLSRLPVRLSHRGRNSSATNHPAFSVTQRVGCRLVKRTASFAIDAHRCDWRILQTLVVNETLAWRGQPNVSFRLRTYNDRVNSQSLNFRSGVKTDSGVVLAGLYAPPSSRWLPRHGPRARVRHGRVRHGSPAMTVAL